MKQEEIFTIITGHCREVLGDLDEYTFQHSDQMKALGANSLERAEIITMTLDSLSLNIPRVDLFGAANIGELAEIVYEKLRSV